jgi:hypothetical protein
VTADGSEDVSETQMLATLGEIWHVGYEHAHFEGISSAMVSKCGGDFLAGGPE